MAGKRQRKGTGSARQVAGGRWQYRRTIDGQQRSFYGATLGEAEAKAQDFVRRERLLDRPPTLEDWLEEWLTRKSKDVRPQTFLSYRGHCALHIIPTIGSVPLNRLQPSDIDKLHAALARRVSSNTAHKVHMTLNKALNDARTRYLVDLVMPAPPRRERVEIETLSQPQVDLLFAAAAGHPLEAAFVLAATLGLREGEILGLQWKHVDLDERTLRVAANASRGIDGSHILGLPKTSAGSRTLTLPQVAVDALRHTLRMGTLVFPGKNDSVMPATTFVGKWTRLRNEASLPPVSFHALRHTAATLALENGVPAHVVAAMLGHASVAITLRLYAHVTHVSLDALADSIDARYGGSRLRLLESGEGTGQNKG